MKIGILNKSKNPNPSYKTLGSAGLDLMASIEKKILINPGERAAISTGIYLELPENMVQEELKIISQNLKNDESEKNKKESEKIAKKRIKLGLILNEIGENNNLKVTEEELKNEINKQIQSMPGQQKQVLEYYKNNPSAAISLKGAIYEEKVINLIKSQSTESKKIVTSIQADEILKNDFNNKKQLQSTLKKDEAKKPKKSAKSLKTNKKIRKK